MTIDKPVKPSLLERAFGIDLRTLALFRIGIALVVLWDLTIRASDLTAHYSDGGVLPRAALIERFFGSPWQLCLHLISGLSIVQALLFLVAAGCASLLLMGYRTRLMTIISWILLISLHHRNPMVIHGGDIVLRMLLFWGMFLPLGARFSVDNAIARTLCPAQENSDLDAGMSTDKQDVAQNADSLLASPQILTVATLAALLQMCFIYWFSAVLKSDVSWRDGTAVYYALSIDQLATPVGKAVLAFPNLVRVLTLATVWLERVGPVLALLPLLNGKIRIGMILVFIGFHAILGLCLTLGIFPVACCIGWLLFLPGSFWDGLARGRHRVFVHLINLAQAIHRLFGRIAEVVPHVTTKKTAHRSLTVSRAWWTQAIAAFFLIYVFCWNLRTTNFAEYSRLFPTSYNGVGYFFGVDQMWGMFAPYPAKDDGWYVVAAQLSNGAQVDLLRGEAVSWNKPQLVSALYKNERWQKYLLKLWEADNAGHRPYFADYWRRHWNDAHDANQQVRSLQIYFMEELTLPNYRTSKPRKVLLGSFRYTP